MDILCHGKECKMLNKTIFCGPKQGNFNATEKKKFWVRYQKNWNMAFPLPQTHYDKGIGSC
jgi:hypothetical protein